MERTSTLTFLEAKSKKKLVNSDDAVVIIFTLDNVTCSEMFLEFVRGIRNFYSEFPQAFSIGFIPRKFQTVPVFLQAINDFSIQKLYFETRPESDLFIYIKEGLDSSQRFIAKREILKASTKHVRELEDGKADLERLVEERTYHIQLSQEEEEHRVSRVRHLIKWTNELAKITSIDDLLVHIKNELKPFHAIGEPMFIIKTSLFQRELMHLRRGEVKRVSFLINQEADQTQKADSKIESQYLANLLGRPVGKLLWYDLEIGMTQRFGFSDARANLVLENSLNAKEVKVFGDTWGEHLKALAISIDRLLLEEELTKYSYRWEKTFDSLDAPIAIVDSELNVVRSNKLFSDRRLRGKCFEIFERRTKPCEGCPYEEVLKFGKSQIGEVKKKDRTLEVHLYPIFLGNTQKPSNFVSLYVDVTHKKDLTQKIIQTEKLSALGALAGHVAHELNNPLTGIRSMSQVLLSIDNLDLQLRQDLHEVDKAAARSQGIIKNLLEFADSDPRGAELVNWDQIVERTLPFLKVGFRNHRLKLAMNSEGKRFSINSRLAQQLVFNLVNNSFQAMERPGTIEITTRFDSNSKNTILMVSDTGSGIPLEIKEKIFEPFFTTKSEGQGTGLGLSLVKEIVERFKGRITVSSELSKGTVFEICFPVIE